MYPRNSSTPLRLPIGYVVDSNGVIQTSGVTVKIIPQGGSEVDGRGTVEYSSFGVVLYTPTQAETNYPAFILVAGKAGCFPAWIAVVPTAENQPGKVSLGPSQVANIVGSITSVTDPVAIKMDQTLPSSPAADTVGSALKDADKLLFDENSYVYANAGSGGGSSGDVQVIVQPLAARVQSPTGDGGIVFCWQNAQLDASWTLENVDLSGDQLAVVLYLEMRPDEMVAQYSEGDLTVTYDPGSSSTLVMLSVPDSRVPPPGNYRYLLWDLTLDQVLVSGYVVVRAAPNPT